MDDMIYRQAAIDVLSMYCVSIGRRNGKALAFEMVNGYANEVKKRIEALPSAQTEIITCKDCKHGMYDVMCKFYWCHGVAHSANWFCADAERRTE